MLIAHYIKLYAFRRKLGIKPDELRTMPTLMVDVFETMMEGEGADLDG